MLDDPELLRRYTSGSQEAFTEFVGRHLNLVYFAALRRTNGNAPLAEEVSQYVFIEAARQAKALARHTSVTGWLYATTRNAAVNAIRAEETRRHHEHNAAMHELTSAEPTQEWERLRPVIDDALEALDDQDREAILIRFFEGRPFAEVGATLRISQDAARMRVDRALDKLRTTLERRGIRSASAALALVLGTQGGLAVPAGLLATISGAALPVAAASVGAATILGFMSGTKITIGALSITAVLAIGFLMIERNRAKEAVVALAAVSQERASLKAQLARTGIILHAAENRAVEAEKDTGNLLEALMAAPAKAPGPAAQGPLQGATLMEEYKKLYSQLYDEESKLRDRIAADVRNLDPDSAFIVKVQAVERYFAAGSFQSAKRRLQEAILERRTRVPLPDSVKKLQAAIAEQTVPVEITFVSDDETLVALTGPGFIRIMPPNDKQVEPVPPGNYQVTGRRRGFRDVVFPLQVRNGVPPPTVNVFCTVPIGP